jgi:hypothetical protein
MKFGLLSSWIESHISTGLPWSVFGLTATNPLFDKDALIIVLFVLEEKFIQPRRSLISDAKT